MAVNKNFVVKNGLEVNTNLIVADTDAQNVGIGTTISRYLLHVNQGTGIGASSVYVTGISTVAQEFNVGLGGTVFTVLGNAEGTAGIGQSVGVGTAEPAYLLDVRSPVSTGQTALYVQGDMRVTGDINLDDLRLDQLQVSGISTFIGLSTFAAGISVLGLGATTTTLNVTGVSTLGGTVDINNSVEVSGITTIQNATQSSASTNGALNVDGGVGIEKNLFVGGGSEITGILTVTNSVDFNSDLDVDGHTELDDTQISGIATVTNTTDSDSKDTGALVVEGGVGIEKNLRVGAGLSVAGLSTFVGVGTFISDLYVGGDLYISDDITLDTNLNILGIATIGTLDVTNYATIGQGLEVSGAGSTTTTLNVTGVSSVSGVSTAALFGGYAALSAPASAETKNFAVTVAAKTSNNRYSGGSSNAYYIDGIEAPFLTLTPGRTYRFTLSSSDMSSHPFRFYLEADKTTAYTTDVTSTATYTEIIVTDTTPTVLHYQCSSHGYMGNSVQTNSNTIVVSAASTFSGVIDSNDATQSSSTSTGSIIASGGVGIAKNLFVGGGAEVTGITTITGALDANSSAEIAGITTVQDTTQASSTSTGALIVSGGAGVAKNLFVGGGAEVTGVTTITGTLDANGDLDVDGHTELDDVNVAGVTTFKDDVQFHGASGITSVSFDKSDNSLKFVDGAKARFGTGDDFFIEHDGTNTILRDTGTGDVFIGGDNNIRIMNAALSEDKAKFTTDGAVELYHNNSKKFETTGYGVTVSGGAFVSGISTFVGFVTFSDYVFIQDGLNVAGVVTATSFDGLGQIGVGSEGTFIGVGITMVDFKSSNASNTVEVNGTSCIATVTVTTGVSIGLAIALGG